MIGRLGVMGVSLLAAGSALASGPDADAEPVEGFVAAGQTVACVSMRSTDIDVVDENRLLFQVGSRYYLNETRGSCEKAGSTFYRVEARLFSPRACRGDFYNVVDNQNGFLVGSCSLGDFEELKKKPRQNADAASEAAR